jgi:hypothetical protein
MSEKVSVQSEAPPLKSVITEAVFLLCFGCLCIFIPVNAVAEPPSGKMDHFTGKVVPLAGIVEGQGAKLDADAAPVSLVLAAIDGKTYSLFKDDGSRMFFKDSRLLNRPMRLTGRLLPGSQILQVVEVQSYLKGELHDVYYWCDVCAIKRFEKKDCDCCGAPMELRETPAKK